MKKILSFSLFLIAGIIFIALSYNIGGPALIISVLSIVLNLILTGIFVFWVKNLSTRATFKRESIII